ncbi:FadR/GntR family transcriptional regulator [uncultured Jannaschia sp.]|uniref:FadR/GntR family transcriptional regulator n=1 Tax=uncultured Jannaschia sp. TaxID=293347 RepID=UPI00262D6731|nr:FadR/GntR family transcriptional regulator [uncultured Jannaschia sp.]
MSHLDLPKRGRLYLGVAETLAARIEAGEYPAGHRMPPERDLAQTLDVSRAVLREALLALEIMRYVEIRLGSGVYVLPKHQRVRTHGALVTLEEVGPYEVLEVRRAIEGLSAYQAAERANSDQLDELTRVLDRMAERLDDVPMFDLADEEFHMLIARATGNSLIEEYVAHLWRMRRNALWDRWYDQTRHISNRRRSVEDHRQILHAIRRRRPDVAQTAMQLHIDVLVDRFLSLDL